MEFCPKCGSVFILKDGKAACAKCSYKPQGKLKIQASQKIEKTLGIAVINEKQLSTYPIVQMKCPKCKNNEAFFWTMQTRSSDEAETKFYKCAKCEFTWRVYR